MKYHLSLLIKSLNRFESRNIIQYLNRHYPNPEKKITKLFNVLKSTKIDEYDPKIKKEIGYLGSDNAFARLKNNLTNELEKSLFILHCDKEYESRVYKYLQLAGIFTGKSMHRQAKFYLNKAEKIASKNEYYHLLSLIIKQQINIGIFLHENPDELIEKQRKYEKAAQSISHVDQLLAKINFELTQTNFLGKERNLTTRIKELVDKLLEDDTLKNSSEVKIKVYQSIRNLLFQQKDFNALSEYLTETYQIFEKEKVYASKKKHQTKIFHLSWIVNSLLKSKQFNQLPSYINLIYDSLYQFEEAFYQQNVWLYFQSRLIEYTFSGKVEEGLELMLQFEQEELDTQPAHLKLYVNLNLCSLYFVLKDMENSIARVSLIISNSSFNKLDHEFQFRILILEIMIRFEMSDLEYAINRSKELVRKFNALLNDDTYSRDKEFVSILIQVLKKPSPFNDEKLLVRIETFISQSPEFEPGSNEVIDYSLWLKSKSKRKSYLDLLPKYLN